MTKGRPICYRPKPLARPDVTGIYPRRPLVSHRPRSKRHIQRAISTSKRLSAPRSPHLVPRGGLSAKRRSLTVENGPLTASRGRLSTKRSRLSVQRRSLTLDHGRLSVTIVRLAVTIGQRTSRAATHLPPSDPLRKMDCAAASKR